MNRVSTPKATACTISMHDHEHVFEKVSEVMKIYIRWMAV